MLIYHEFQEIGYLKSFTRKIIYTTLFSRYLKCYISRKSSTNLLYFLRNFSTAWNSQQKKFYQIKNAIYDKVRMKKISDYKNLFSYAQQCLCAYMKKTYMSFIFRLLINLPFEILWSISYLKTYILVNNAYKRFI